MLRVADRRRLSLATQAAENVARRRNHTYLANVFHIISATLSAWSDGVLLGISMSDASVSQITNRISWIDATHRSVALAGSRFSPVGTEVGLNVTLAGLWKGFFCKLDR